MREIGKAPSATAAQLDPGLSRIANNTRFDDRCTGRSMVMAVRAMHVSMRDFFRGGCTYVRYVQCKP